MLLQMLPPIHCPVSTAGLAISAVQCLNILSFATKGGCAGGTKQFAEIRDRIKELASPLAKGLADSQGRSRRPAWLPAHKRFLTQTSPA